MLKFSNNSMSRNQNFEKENDQENVIMTILEDVFKNNDMILHLFFEFCNLTKKDVFLFLDVLSYSKTILSVHIAGNSMPLLVEITNILNNDVTNQPSSLG